MALGRRYERAHLKLTIATVGGTAVPLIYYAILGKTDLSWKLAQVASKHAFSFWSITIAIVPLLVPAAVAYSRRPTTFLAAATRTWPLAAFAIFVLSGTSLGATPLALLPGDHDPAVGARRRGLPDHRLEPDPAPGARRRGPRRAVHDPDHVRGAEDPHALAAPTTNNANFIKGDERDALNYLENLKEPGSVMTRSYLGAYVPGKTGRRTYVGDCLWSEPGCLNLTYQREHAVPDKGRADPGGRLRASSSSSGARFVLADCQTTVDLRTLLGPIIRSAHGFGCAAVYEVE